MGYWSFLNYLLKECRGLILFFLSVLLSRNDYIYLCVCVCVCVCVSCSVVFDSLQPFNCSPPGSSVHGIFQAGILEWIAIPFSRVTSQPRDQTHVSCIAGRFFTV